MKLDIYKMVTDKIIEELKKGFIPWHKPWSPNSAKCFNYATGKSYKGINTFLLTRNGEYLTFNQCKQAGGNVKKGAKAEFVVFFTQVESKELDADGNPKLIPMLKYYNVFHISDCEGIKPKIQIVDDNTPKHTDIETADKVIKDYTDRESKNGLQYFEQKSDKAYYSPAGDIVVVPERNQFDTIEEFYSTSFHELAHSTKKSTRCNRNSDKLSFFGSKEYSKEELVAEMTAAMLCSYVGIDCKSTFKNSVAYIQSWLKALKNDNKMIVWASSRAETAANYILDIKE